MPCRVEIFNTVHFAVPLTKEMCLAFSWHFIIEKRVEAAVILLLTYSACQRVSEDLQLEWKDIAFPGDVHLFSCGGVAGINIWEAKTSRRTGRLQFVLLTDKLCIKFLRTYKSSRPEQENLVGISYASYLDSLKRASQHFGMKNTRISTHSARVGKATQDYIQRTPVEQIAMNGRWKSMHTLRYYVDNGRAWLLNIPINKDSQQLLKSCANSAKSSIMNQPPDKYYPQHPKMFLQFSTKNLLPLLRY